MIRTAIIGSGYNLRYYIDILRNIPDFLVTGVFNEELFSALPGAELPLSVMAAKPEELADISEALVVTDNAGNHYDTIVRFLKRARHVLVMHDHPSLSYCHFKKLSKIAEEAGVIIHFHQHTLDSSVKDKVRRYIERPEYITLTCQIRKDRHKPDKGIFDVLHSGVWAVFDLNPFNIRKLNTSAVPFYSPDPDLINARIEFENGTSVLITISAFTGNEKNLIEIYGKGKMIRHDLNSRQITFFEKGSSGEITERTEEISEQMNHDDVFSKFARYIKKEMLHDNRYEGAIAACQTTAAVINQIRSCAVIN